MGQNWSDRFYNTRTAKSVCTTSWTSCVGDWEADIEQLSKCRVAEKPCSPSVVSACVVYMCVCLHVVCNIHVLVSIGTVVIPPLQ